MDYYLSRKLAIEWCRLHVVDKQYVHAPGIPCGTCQSIADTIQKALDERMEKCRPYMSHKMGCISNIVDGEFVSCSCGVLAFFNKQDAKKNVI